MGFFCQMAKAVLFISLLFSFPADASIIKFPPSGERAFSYQDLICTEQDKADIDELITTMAENGYLELLWNKSHLKQIGARINHVHPLKFLATIFTVPRLIVSMDRIFDDALKKIGLMEGLGPSLDREARKGTLNGYIVDFSNEIHVPPEKIQVYFQTKEWEDLVRTLIRP